MGTSELKSNLHQLIDDINDRSILKAVHTLLSAKHIEEEDWWDELSKEQKTSIEIGLKEAEDGKVIPHDDVMKQVRDLLKNHE